MYKSHKGTLRVRCASQKYNNFPLDTYFKTNHYYIVFVPCAKLLLKYTPI